METCVLQAKNANTTINVGSQTKKERLVFQTWSLRQEWMVEGAKKVTESAVSVPARATRRAPRPSPDDNSWSL